MFFRHETRTELKLYKSACELLYSSRFRTVLHISTSLFSSQVLTPFFQKPVFPQSATTFTQFFPQLLLLEAAARRWVFCCLPWSTSWRSRSCSRARDPLRWSWNPRENWPCRRMRPGKVLGGLGAKKICGPNMTKWVKLQHFDVLISFVSLGVVSVELLGGFWTISLPVLDSGWHNFKHYVKNHVQSYSWDLRQAWKKRSSSSKFKGQLETKSTTKPMFSFRKDFRGVT